MVYEDRAGPACTHSRLRCRVLASLDPLPRLVWNEFEVKHARILEVQLHVCLYIRDRAMMQDHHSPSAFHELGVSRSEFRPRDQEPELAKHEESPFKSGNCL